MIKSMTGYGKSQSSNGGYEISVEMKGVNHRYFDLHLRIPRRYMLLEDRIKEELKQYIARGRVEVAVNVELNSQSARVLQLDKELAMAYYKALKDLGDFLDIPSDTRLIEIFRLPDVYRLSENVEDLEELWALLARDVAAAARSMVQMRVREGENLFEDICARCAYILQQVETLEQRVPEVNQAYETRLRTRLEECLAHAAISADEGHIIQEVAFFADKASITEELVRLRSHLRQMEEMLRDGDNVGKKCDFLMQEMFREINTVASKANDLSMSQIVVDVKSELEKIREQIQNVE
ncbi:MAG: YicC/YloC family endoribonuclease [Syntrophomonadaceae bacterium]|nr:YicC/YloC family endoribonuclease [Syntrophomonadaceae bacterium]